MSYVSGSETLRARGDRRKNVDGRLEGLQSEPLTTEFA